MDDLDQSPAVMDTAGRQLAAYPPSTRLRIALASIAGLLHAFAVSAVLMLNGSRSGETTRLLALSYVFAAVSITAVWTVAGGLSFLKWRAPLTGVLLAVEWMLLMRVLGEPLPSAEGAGWAALVATQYVLLGGIVWLLAGVSKTLSSEVRFSVGQMLLSVTLLALYLGSFRFAGLALGWNQESLEWEYFFYCPVFGTYNAVTASTVVAGLASRTLFRKILLGAAGVAAGVPLGILFHFTLLTVFGSAGGLHASELAVCLAVQAAIVWVSVFPFWRWPCGLGELAVYERDSESR